MSKNNNTRRWARRAFLKSSTAFGLTALAPALYAAEQSMPPGMEALIGTECPPKFFAEGPYYPALEELPWGSDLTTVSGKDGVASGQIVYVFGKITTSGCAPLGNAHVELWQSDKDGRYNHPTAKRLAGSDAIDPYFRYFGKVVTQLDGFYLFKTILPKWYTVFGIKRCAHIHFRISHIDYGSVVTQMMFEGEEQDKIRLEDPEYLNAPPHVKAKVVVAKQIPSDYPELSSSLQMEESALLCQFDQSFI